MATNAFKDLNDYEKKLDKYVKTKPEKRDANMLNDLLSSNYSFDNNLSDSARLQVEQLRKNNSNSNTNEPVVGPKNLSESILDGQLTTAQYSNGNMPIRKTVPGTAVVDKPAEGPLEFNTYQELNNHFEGDEGKIVDWLINNPGYEIGPGTTKALGEETVANIQAARKEKEQASPVNKTNSTNSGIDDTKSKIADLQSKIAPNNHDYESPDVFNPKTKTSSGYRSIVSDVLDVIRADRDVKTAKNSDKIRSGAKDIQDESKENLKDIKSYNKNSRLLDKALNNKAIQAKKDELANVNSEIKTLDKERKDNPTIGIENDTENLVPLFGEEGTKKLQDLEIKKLKLQDDLNYMVKDNGLEKEINIYLDENSSPEARDAALARLQELVPGLVDNLNNQIELSKEKLGFIGNIVDSIGDPELKDLYNNVFTMAQVFSEKGFDVNDPKLLKEFQNFIDETDKIIKNQDLYQDDIRFASDAKLSAVNRLVFDIFDDLKTAFVFLVAAEAGSPQLIRSSIQTYNNKLQQAEADYKVGLINEGYKSNAVRDMTGENIADFYATSQAKPQLDFLSKQLGITEGEAQKRIIQSYEAAFEEYNKYMNAHPNDKVSFGSWVQSQKTSNVNSIYGLLGMLLGAGLTNVKQLDNMYENAQTDSTAEGNYAEGGIVGESEGATAGPDNTTINAREGEMVLNADQQKKLWDFINGKGRVDNWMDNATKKASKSSKESEPKKDPALTMDIQNTVNQALAARSAPPQGAAPQAGAPKTNSGFGRTNLS